MKLPMRFQITEYDCGTTSLMNALVYLFDREDIPVSLLRAIYRYTLDKEGKTGVIGEGGTSTAAVETLTCWITKYANNNNFGLKCEMLEGQEVNLSKIKKCVDNNGCVLVRCYLDNYEHYVIITGMDDNSVYLFDPYYLEENYYDKDPDVDIVLNQTFTHNRIVKLSRLMDDNQKDFSLMKIEKREAVLINRI